jgi:hypothetical protein
VIFALQWIVTSQGLILKIKSFLLTTVVRDDEHLKQAEAAAS